MDTDKLRCLLIVVLLFAFAPASCSSAEAEEKLLSENFVPDKTVRTEPALLEAEKFPWEFELTKRFMICGDQLSRCRTAFLLRISEAEIDRAEGFELENVNWGFEFSKYVMERRKPPLPIALDFTFAVQETEPCVIRDAIDFDWSLMIAERFLGQRYPYKEPMTFGGVGFNR